MTRARNLSRLGNTNALSVDNSNNVGIASTIPTEKLDVVGVVSATEFYGDGSNLSGITAGATLSAGSGAQRVVVTSLTSGTMTTAATDAELTYNSDTDTLSATTFSGALTGNASGTAGGLTGSPNITINNLVGVAATFTGVLTYEDVTNIDSVGIITAQSGIFVGAGESISPVSGTITYYGDGSQLTGISAGGISSAPYNTVSGGTTVELDLTNYQHHELSMAAGITTISCTGGVAGDTHSVIITNAGICTVGFSTYFLWPSGSIPSLPTGVNEVSLLSFVVRRVGVGGTQLFGSAGISYN